MPEPSLDPTDHGIRGCRLEVSLLDTVREEWTAVGLGETNGEYLTLNPRTEVNWENEVYYFGEKTRLFPKKIDEHMAIAQPSSLMWNNGQSTFTKGRPSQGCLTEPLVLELRH